MAALLDYTKASPEAYQAMFKLSQAAHHSTLEPALQELVRTRASQINNCAFCLDMHTKDARAAGESEMRLYTLSAWRETSFFTERERAALAWTEAVTRLSEAPVEEGLFHEAREHFSEKELVDLTLVIIAINGWNRFGAVFRSEPGHYQPRAHAKSA
ncbi:MAG: carboxymuconolactone decarboxylase family protein [Stellaceae bacterium]